METFPVPMFHFRFGWNSSSSFVYLLGADDMINFDYLKLSERVKNSLSRWGCFAFYRFFAVYQGHHWEIGAEQGDLVLPSLVFVETEGLYLNYAGESRRSSVVVGPYGEAESDWEIIRALEASIHWSTGLQINWTKFKDMHRRRSFRETLILEHWLMVCGEGLTIFIEWGSDVIAIL